MPKHLAVLKSRVTWLLATVSLIVFYFLFNPAEYGWMPQCFFYKVTGLKCMGCGSQRMIHHLLHGDFVSAFHQNMFLFCCLPFLLVLGYLELNRKKHPRFYARMHSLFVIIFFSVLLAIWFIVRNLLNI